jgi:competence protein ComEC
VPCALGSVAIVAGGVSRASNKAQTASILSSIQRGRRISIARGHRLRCGAYEEDCRRAALLVATRGDPPADCRAKVIPRGLWRQRGALALRRQQGADGVDFVIDSARPKNFDRPWSPALARRETPPTPIATEPSAKGTRLGAPRDATPRQEDIEADQ